MGTLVVKVVDERGNRVADALVSLEGVTQETLTQKGTYWFALLLPGAYIPVVKTAFQEVQFKEALRVHEGRLTEVELIVPVSATRPPPPPPPAAPVETRTGTIQGAVVDEDGRPLQWANVIVINAQRGAQTDSKGRFLIQGVPIGVHTVRVRMVGFKREDRQRVDVSDGGTTTVDFKLNPQAVKLKY